MTFARLLELLKGSLVALERRSSCFILRETHGFLYGISAYTDWTDLAGRISRINYYW